MRMDETLFVSTTDGRNARLSEDLRELKESPFRGKFHKKYKRIKVIPCIDKIYQIYTLYRAKETTAFAN